MNSGLMGAGAQNRSFGNMYSDQQSACGQLAQQAPMPTSAMDSSLSGLNATIDTIQALTNELEKRLSPVSVASPTSACMNESAVGGSYCELESRIDVATRTLSGTVSQLRSMIDALRI